MQIDRETYQKSCDAMTSALMIDWNDVLKKNQYTTAGKKVLSSISKVAIAAVATLFLGITAYATEGFGLLSKHEISDPYPEFETIQVVDDEGQTTTLSNENTMPLSNQGYPDSKEYQATQEWCVFLADYDKDGSILNSVGNQILFEGTDWFQYNVYTEEMGHKLDEIVTKYGLTYLGDFHVVDSLEELTHFGAVNPAKTRDRFFEVSGYIYDAGTYQLEGENIANDTIISYQMRFCKKGVFDEVLDYVNPDSFLEEYVLTTTDGIHADVTVMEDHTVMFVDLPNAFVSFNLQQTITREDAEAFLEEFDFVGIEAQ